MGYQVPACGPVRSVGRSAGGDTGTGRGPLPGDLAAGPARRHRGGEDVHDGFRHRRRRPARAVEFFVSYYDYYQPEAYVPHTDTYIEKDSSINEQIDKMRHSATRSVMTRGDVIVIASVSCIYGLGSPEYYGRMTVRVSEGAEFPRNTLLRRLIDLQYERNDVDFHRGTFRVRGDAVELSPSYEEERVLRIEYDEDRIARIRYVDPLRGTRLQEAAETVIFPASHYVTPEDQLERAGRGVGEG